MPEATLAFYLVAIPAVVILGVGKGGFAGIGMISLPLIALVMPPLQAASVMLPILVLQDVLSSWAFRRTWSGRNLTILLPGAAVGVFLAYLLASRVASGAVDVAVGGISMLFGGKQLLDQVRGAIASASRPGIVLGWICGAAAGFTSMLAHAGAPPFQIYTVPQRLPRDVFVGTSVIFFTALNWMKIGPFIALGQITRDNMLLAATLAPLAVASTWLGVWLVRRTAGPLFFTIIYMLMVAIGVRLCLRGIAGI